MLQVSLPSLELGIVMPSGTTVDRSSPRDSWWSLQNKIYFYIMILQFITFSSGLLTDLSGSELHMQVDSTGPTLTL